MRTSKLLRPCSPASAMLRRGNLLAKAGGGRALIEPLLATAKRRASEARVVPAKAGTHELRVTLVKRRCADVNVGGYTATSVFLGPRLRGDDVVR